MAPCSTPNTVPICITFGVSFAGTSVAKEDRLSDILDISRCILLYLFCSDPESILSVPDQRNGQLTEYWFLGSGIGFAK